MRRIVYYALLSTLIGVWGCRKDVETFHPYGSSIAEIGQLLGQVPDQSTLTLFNFPAGLSADTVLSTSSGVRVHLTDVDHLFVDANGNPVAISTCGAFRIEVEEAFLKGDILGRGLQTTTTSQALLESGGILRVQAFCSGQPLLLANDRTLKVQITTAQDDLQPDMKVFNAVFNTDQSFGGWEDSGQEVYWAGWPTQQGQKVGYELIIKQLNWVNCARAINEQSSSFCVSLPVAYDGENTEVFVAFKNQRTIIPLEYDETSGTFCMDQAPIGHLIKVVSVSKAGNRYWLGSSDTEIGTNATLPLNPEETSASAILSFLKGL
ncbi:MAG TPA: hypothetical protein PKL15_08120 [Saprospiraceae bacterium]|nr:hypothetical protein [Saprospiraceae bacterium]HNL38065.1 hypothetical protein [Saprospiraceae bacterium]HNM25379.1 hypothetical protein [Saprospiraceae bacterium]